MDVTFANAGAFECLLIGSLIVLIGIALPGVRKHLLKTSAGFDGAPIYTLINYSAACVLTLSLPIFLSHSSNPIEFILNAVASTFIIQLDDAPAETLTYTISDAARADIEEAPSAPRVSELSTVATGQK